MKIASLFKPQVIIAGLSISNTAIRLVRFSGEVLEKESVVLGPGIIKDGKLRNWDKFVSTLLVLRSQLGKTKEKIPVTISIPADNIYIGKFNLPSLGEADFSAAAALNMQMTSPIDIKDAYYDWQKLNGEFLGAFVHRNIVDKYISALNKAGFSVMAVEPPALAITRIIKDYSAGLNLARSQIVLLISSDGLEFLVIKDGNLHFSHFIASDAMQNFNHTLVDGLKKAFQVHKSGQVILITPNLYQDIEKVIKEKFSSVKVRSLALSKFSNLTSVWHAGLGSALRGAASHSGKLINLTPAETAEELHQLETRFFKKLWQKTILSFLGLGVAVFLATAVFLSATSYQLQKQISSNARNPEVEEANLLRQKAQEFNQLLNKVLSAKAQSNYFAPIFSELRTIGRKSRIDLIGIVIDSEQQEVIVKGIADSESDVIKFKNRLAAEELFKDATLPLSNLITNKDGSVSFSLSLVIK